MYKKHFFTHVDWIGGLYSSKQIFNQIRMFILHSARVKSGENLDFRPPFCKRKKYGQPLNNFKYLYFILYL